MVDYKKLARERAIKKEIKRLKNLKNYYKCSEEDKLYIDNLILKLEEELKV